MDCTKSSVEKVESRGVADGKCSVCGSQIMIKGSYRSIWYDGFTGGGGEVRNVGTTYCPKCDGEPESVEMGTPIYESELIKVATA